MCEGFCLPSRAVCYSVRSCVCVCVCELRSCGREELNFDSHRPDGSFRLAIKPHNAVKHNTQLPTHYTHTHQHHPTTIDSLTPRKYKRVVLLLLCLECAAAASSQNSTDPVCTSLAALATVSSPRVVVASRLPHTSASWRQTFNAASRLRARVITSRRWPVDAHCSLSVSTAGIFVLPLSSCVCV